LTDQQPQPDLDEAPGWYVTDPDGNVVASGPMSEALPVSAAGETDPEGDE
jgi:hypothetical protein